MKKYEALELEIAVVGKDIVLKSESPFIPSSAGSKPFGSYFGIEGVLEDDGL